MRLEKPAQVVPLRMPKPPAEDDELPGLPFVFLRLERVLAAVDMGRSKVAELLDPKSPRYDPRFPKPRRVGARSIRWRSDELAAWKKAQAQGAVPTRDINELQAACIRMATTYPAVPPPMPDAESRNAIPAAPGIYFLWLGEVVDYVGQSLVLRRRLKSGNHHRMAAAHGISFVLIDRSELTWAECWYIGLLKPRLNAAPRIHRKSC